MLFENLGLSAPILRAVVGEGYTEPTPIQEQAIPHIMQGFDLLGCAQTGTGKTAAFALPLLHRLMDSADAARAKSPKGRARKIRVLVLSPTRELASQIAESFQVYGKHTSIRETVIYGGVSQHGQTKALKSGVDVLIATPGRLLDLMGQGFVDLSSIETFVLDEADRMMDMGFLPDLKRIIAKIPVERQTLFFSATMPTEIENLAHSILKNPVQVRIAPVQATTELIEQSVRFVSKGDKTKMLADLLGQDQVTRAIVFTRTKHGADRVALQLSKLGIPSEAIHGNKSQNARQRALASFKSNRTWVLVATDLAARGLDVDNISHVINYDLPHEPETYVHRIGRTGRAGSTGIATSFCDADERKHLKAIERLLRQRLPATGESFPPDTNSAESTAPAHGKYRPDGKRPAHARPAKATNASTANGARPNGNYPPRKKKRRRFVGTPR